MDIAIIFGLILLNGIFAMSEIAIVSAKQLRLQQAAEAGDAGASMALQLSHEPSRFLSTIQIGITLIGILAGAFGEASIADRLAAYFQQDEWLAPYARPLAMTLMVIIITYLSLIFGELVPKRLALMNPEVIAKVVSRPMDVLAKVARPLVWLLSASTDILLKLLRAKKREEDSIIEEEIHSLIKQGTETGVLEISEHDMVKNVLRLDDQRVGNLMTLRKELFYIDLDDSYEENCRKLASTSFSRIPVCQGGIDKVIGILHTKDLLAPLLRGEKPDFRALLKHPLMIPRYASALQLLEQFKRERHPMALVIDEHEQTSGLVSVNDVMAAIVGDLPSEDQDYEPDFIAREDGSWLVCGQIDIVTFKDKFSLRALPDEDSNHYHTLGGLMLTMLGHVPRTGEHVDLPPVRLEVMDMDGNRVDKVLVTPLRHVNTHQSKLFPQTGD